MLETPWFFKKTARLEFILRAEKVKWQPHDGYGFWTSPRYWGAVFVRYYGETPNGKDDPRWDKILKLGFPITRTLRSALTR